MWLLQAFLLNEDLGDSLDSVEALLKKHEDFEKSLSAQEEKITVGCCFQAAASRLRVGAALQTLLSPPPQGPGRVC